MRPDPGLEHIHTTRVSEHGQTIEKGFQIEALGGDKAPALRVGGSHLKPGDEATLWQDARGKLVIVVRDSPSFFAFTVGQHGFSAGSVEWPITRAPGGMCWKLTA